MKKVLCAVCAIVMMLGVAGCGKGGDTAKSGKVTLLIGAPEGENLTPMELIENFKALHPDINVETDITPWNDFAQKLKMQMTTNDPVPVFLTDSGTAAEFAGKGAVVDLNDRIKELDSSLYTDALYAGKDADGKIWGVPQAINPIAIIYNKAIFDQCGVDYPDENWTWDDMMDIARKLTIVENGETTVYGFYSGNYITTGWLPYIVANGAAPLDSTMTKSNFSDPKVVDAFKKYGAPFHEGISPPGGFIDSNGGVQLSFANGKIAMMIELAGNLSIIEKNAPEGFDYDAQIMPIGWDGNRYCVYVPNVWQISSKASKEAQDAAWEWIKYYLSPEAQMIVAQKGKGGFPIEKSALAYFDTAKSKPANKKAFYEGIDKYGVTLFENPCWLSWEQEVERRFSFVTLKETDIEAKVAEIDKAVQEALDEYYK